MPAFDPAERPTKEIVEKETIYYEKLWREAHDDMAKADRYYFQTNNIWEDLVARLQNARPQVHLATAPGLVQHAVDAHLAFEPKWHREPTGEGEAHKQAANRVEDAWGEIVSNAIAFNNRFPTKINGLQLVRHNYTQLHVHLNHDMLTRPVKKEGETQEDFDEREESWSGGQVAWNPISIEVPAPGEVLMDPTRKWPQIAIQRKKVLALDLADLVKQKGKRRDVEILDGYEMGKADPYDDVEVILRWSPPYIATMRKDGGLVYVEPNPYGFSPFTHCFGGSADMPMGEEFDVKWYVRQALLFKVMEAIKMEAQARFAQNHIIMRTALAKNVYRGDPAEAAEADKGDILPGSPDDWGIEKVPTLAAQTEEYLRGIRDNIEFGTYSLQQAGMREPGSDTATKAMILAEAGSRTFKAAVKSQEGLWSIGGTMGLRCLAVLAKGYPYGEVEHGGKTDNVYQVGKHPLRISDLEGNYRIEATFEQVDVAVAMQEAAQANQDLKDGLIDYETWARIRRFENPTEIQDGIIRDSVRQWPEILAARGIAAAEQLGYDEIVAAKEEELRKARLQRKSSGLVNPQGQPISSEPMNGRVS